LFKLILHRIKLQYGYFAYPNSTHKSPIAKLYSLHYSSTIRISKGRGMDASLLISNNLKALLPWMVLIAIFCSRAFFICRVLFSNFIFFAFWNL